MGREAGRQEGIGAVMPQEGEDSLIERLGRKKPAQEVLVTIQQALPTHLGYEVKAASIHGGVPITVSQKASF